VNSPKREVYFGNSPRMVQSKLEMDSSLKRSRADSVRKDYGSRDLGVLEINTPVRDKDRFELPKVKKSPQMSNPFNTGGNLFKHFSDQEIQSRQNILSNLNQ
jgi:hypothetical protein